MEEEIKKAYMDWSEKGVSYLNCMYVYDTMMDVDEALQTCDTILDEIDLGIDYTSRKKDIDRLLEGHGTLHRYIDVLNCYVDDKLDQPLKKDFKKNATETISRIHLEDFEVDNTLGLTENNYITGGMGYAGTMVEQEKAKLTFADFIGTSDGKADGNGLHMAYTNGSVEDFASIFAAQYEAMKASGALGEDNNLTQQEFLEQFYRQGEFTHDSSNPFLNFVSSVLDITIIKPIIEACTGEDLITGEDLTDMERGLKVVFAMVDLVTLGGAIAATKFSEMGLKEGLKAFGKTALIDFAGNTAACGVGALGETFDWPVPITMMLSLAAGITVSISGNKLLFKNADGIEIGAKTLDEREWKSFRDLMSPEEAARYDKYWYDSITSIPKGERPDPTTYLSQEYIDGHLAKFENGVSVIQTEWAYGRYSETNGFVGVPDDNTLFVLPKEYCDSVIQKANGDISIIEEELGFPKGYFKNGGGLVRIDVDNVSDLNIRVPSGNEATANDLWIPGGYTSGGVPEAITDTIPLDRTHVTRIDIN